MSNYQLRTLFRTINFLLIILDVIIDTMFSANHRLWPLASMTAVDYFFLLPCAVSCSFLLDQYLTTSKIFQNVVIHIPRL